uniref:Uncharacterized protein n=1 Tax=Chromera velia CCMP2878 TaxID=1169474 RepID=A0A0G4HWL8_9ALVE|eukprot:Cvel_32721.t1-p1 / transcript=Cvel_32721.t1 / gene=Cvel_32721 / organism=Chromera_velia_CCMP2878 / gene_product=hypothetical protein / transcript_product=hypothetical protein / location=Cvel_scaffold5154:2107-4182(-) / protein_length=539 / sequence_SO=supercontig / SO=protein_coding / is_pseudo=false
MYRLVVFCAFLGTSLLRELPGVSAAWLKEPSLSEDQGLTFLQQRRTFTHSLRSPAHHAFKAWSNKTREYTNDPRTLDLLVNVIDREDIEQGEVHLSHNVANYGFSFFFVGNTESDQYEEALDTTLTTYKAATNIYQFRDAQAWANANLFPHIASMITANVAGVDRVELIGSTLWNTNANLVWDQQDAEKYVKRRISKRFPQENWLSYKSPKFRLQKRKDAATVFCNILNKTCYAHACPKDRERIANPHTVTCPDDGGCTDNLCCKAPLKGLKKFGKYMQDFCGTNDDNLVPASCTISGRNAVPSFPALHVDHFHSLTMELDLGYLGIMDRDTNWLSNDPVYFYKGTERKGYPPAYRVTRQAPSRLEFHRQSHTVYKVSIVEMKKGDFIFFETLKAMLGALSVVDDDYQRCPSKCCNSIKFRFITLEERVFLLMDEHDKQLMHIPKDTDMDTKLEQTPEDIVNSNSKKGDDTTTDESVKTTGVTGSDDVGNDDVNDFAQLASSQVAHTHHAQAVARHQKQTQRESGWRPPTVASEVQTSE